MEKQKNKRIFPAEEYFCNSCGDYCRDNGEYYDYRLCVNCYHENINEDACDCGVSVNECVCGDTVFGTENPHQLTQD